MDLYGDAAEYFYGNCLHIDPRFAAPPGYATEPTQRMGMLSQVSAAAAKSKARPGDMQELVDSGYLVIGTPDEVAEQIDELSTNLHVGNLMLLIQFGNMSKELTKYNTRLFAEQVMPKVKDLFGDWEDKWWPKPLARGQRASVPAFRPQLAAAE